MSIKQDLPSSVFLGLEILRKYFHDADVEAAEPDIIYSSVNLQMAEYANISKEDIIKLRRMNWMIDEEYFASFV